MGGVMAYDGVTAVSWGPYRAEFVGPVDGGHTVRIRLHDSQKDDFLVDVTVTDDTEVGLRAALWTFAQDRKAETPLREADAKWHTIVDRRAPLPVVERPRTPQRTKKTAKRTR